MPARHRVLPLDARTLGDPIEVDTRSLGNGKGKERRIWQRWAKRLGAEPFVQFSVTIGKREWSGAIVVG